MASGQVSQFGIAMRARRAEAGITLEQLAAACGVSIGTLSRIERSGLNTSLANAVAIATSLGTTVDALLQARQEVSVQRAGDAQTFTDQDSGVVRTLIARPTAAAELIRYTLPAKTSTARFAPHGPGTTEILHVTAGAVTISSGPDEPITLQSGDTAHMPADREHQLSNPAHEPSTIVILIIRPAL
ncbi:helix-turn-helix domain-containing protein [Streptomyces sp. NPDC091280]|uniref:helix-turn-helix domain-containing protein n=1 Tax=Streptomyces sp. NPDC091280 TaxID=3365984 RepID=UPI003801CA79